MQNYVHLLSTYLETESPLDANESCRKFFVDVQDVFIYCIWLSKSKVMVRLVSQPRVVEFLDNPKLD